MPKLATILLLSCMPLSVYARKITFSYDAAGNRVKRELVIPQSNKSLRESTDTDQNYNDLVGERTVTISQRSTGFPEVEPAIPLEPFFPTDPNKVPTVNPDKPLW